MAKYDKDFDLARLDEQIEHPANTLDAPARHLVEDLEQMYRTPAAESQANAASLQRVQSRLQARFETRLEPTIVPLPGHSRHKKGYSLMHDDRSERKPAWTRLTQVISPLAAALLLAVLVGSAGVLFYLKSHATGSHPTTQTGTTTTPTATPIVTPTVKLDCSHIFTNPDIGQFPDHGEHAVCLQNLETPLSGTKSIYGHKITLIAAYADANRLMIKFSVDGQNASLTEGGVVLTYLSVGTTQLGPTDGGGYYYDKQKKQTVYLNCFDTTLLPANTTTLQVTATFLSLSSYQFTQGESASFTFTMPMQQEKHSAALDQVGTINGHQLTLTRLQVTPSMTRLYIKADSSVQPAQAWALEATMNDSTSTFIGEDPPTAGKYDPIKGFIVTSLEDFTNHPADTWTVHLNSFGRPLGQGTLDIPFTVLTLP